ncbi:Rpn family recombination-promoting nuclease/putative transposase [Palleniella muris]|uniref:Rpn family recombination-promoting nuclease/putative transposase n=1 Tax=Palleniella muris TaxID=3038145 RepID=A0AC61QQR1_9BACT|nr:Rpn family recombination-promoting nuclease/putative transposase [Palleniella muris]TGX82513.1 Rpn family recombination-promoting nuclease/putative transposase [Palleniella muris]
MGNYIRFDWAIKKLLRQKANFVVLEGFISSLLEKKVKIECLLESEGNVERDDEKHNRVDMLVGAENGEKYIIEVQNSNETAYFQRMLFGTSQLIKDYLHKGEGYENVQKVYSINIVYFDLGKGDDYIYHGYTEFRGVHDGKLLNLSPFQMEMFDVSEVKDIFPEYYILKVNGFNDVARTPIEQWIEFLKNGDIPDNATAPGLSEAREIMRYDKMSAVEKCDYDHHLKEILILRGQVDHAVGEARLEARAEALIEGRAEGRAEGLMEGREEEKRSTILRMQEAGASLDMIAIATGLSAEDIKRLLDS